MSYLILYIFCINLMCLILIRKHILLCLIRFEFIVISLLVVILRYCLMFNYSYYLYLIIITFYVCEGVIGLGILVRLIRSHGNDYLNSMLL